MAKFDFTGIPKAGYEQKDEIKLALPKKAGSRFDFTGIPSVSVDIENRVFTRTPDQQDFLDSLEPTWGQKLALKASKIYGRSPNSFKYVSEKILAPTVELPLSLTSGMFLWPFSKAYGLMALPFGRETADMAEKEIAKLGYQPNSEGARQASEWISKGMDLYLTPSKMAGEEIEKYSPEAAYLLNLGGELMQFAFLGAGIKAGKGKLQQRGLPPKPKVAETFERTTEQPPSKSAGESAQVFMDEFARSQKPSGKQALMDDLINKGTREAPPPAPGMKQPYSGAPLEIPGQEGLPYEPIRYLLDKDIKAPRTPHETRESLSHLPRDAEATLKKATETTRSLIEPKVKAEFGIREDLRGQGLPEDVVPREYGLKILDRTIPEPKKVIAQNFVDNLTKQGKSVKESAILFDEFLRQNQSFKGRVELKTRLKSEQLSAGVQDAYVRWQDVHKIRSLVDENPRTIDSILRDINNLIGKKGQITPKGIVLSPEQLKAAVRLKKDIKVIKKNAERTGKSIKEYLEGLGYPKEIAVYMEVENIRKDAVSSALISPKEIISEEVEVPAKDIVSGKAGTDVENLVRRRRADIDIGFLESEAFIIPIENELTAIELEAIPFIRQGIKDPNVLKKIGREDLIPIIQNPPERVRSTANKIGKYYDESFNFLNENWGDVNFIEDYVTHIWDIPKKRRTEVVNYFATKNPFIKKRTIPSLEEGIKLGLEPKFLNIADLLRIYDQYKIKTAHNFKFAEALKEMKAEDGSPLLLPRSLAPEGWVPIDHYALNKSVIRKAYDPKKKLHILMKETAYVDPEVAPAIKRILDKPFQHWGLSAAETVNAFTKKSMLSLSLFHHLALTEAAWSTGIGIKSLKLFNPFKAIEAIRNKNYEIFKQMPLAKDSIEHGVTYGALADYQISRVQKALKVAERKTKNIPGIKQVTKGIRTANDLWDKALWDYMHNTFKLYAYEENVFHALKKAESRVQKQSGRSLNEGEITAIKREMADFVNNSFGGQNWDLNKITGNPKTRQLLQLAFLSPDWNISVLKQAMAPLEGIRKTVKGKTATDRLAGKALTQRSGLFWVRALLYFNLIAQSVNYYNTKKEYGKGRFTWENAPGHGLNVFAGRNSDGTEKYYRWGKQFRETLELATDPIGKIGSKVSPVVRETTRQFTAHDPGSGYPTEWAEAEDWKESAKERGLSILEMPLPLSLRSYVQSRPTNFLFTLPASRGMTNHKAVKLFKQALKAGDAERVRTIFISALENNLEADQLFKSANSAIKADITYDTRKLVREIFNEYSSIPDSDIKAKTDLIQTYKKRGTLTLQGMFELQKMIEKRGRVENIRRIFEIEPPNPAHSQTNEFKKSEEPIQNIIPLNKKLNKPKIGNQSKIEPSNKAEPPIKLANNGWTLPKKIYDKRFREVDVEATRAETGEKVKIKMNADVVLEDIRKKRDVYKQVLACVGA